MVQLKLVESFPVQLSSFQSWASASQFIIRGPSKRQIYVCDLPSIPTPTPPHFYILQLVLE